MRRFVCYIVSLCLVLLCGCSGTVGNFLDYQNNVASATVTWDIKGKVFTAEITFDGEIPEDSAVLRPATVTVSAPRISAAL